MTITRKIGLGTVQFGLDYGISNKTGKPHPEEVAAILNYARNIGIHCIDTARAYGDSEIILGNNKVADHFNIVSKFMPSVTDGSICQQFEQSCENLKTERLYAYLAHRPLALITNKDDWTAAQSLKAQNRIQKIGFSLNEPRELELLIKENMNPDLIQVPYNYFDNRFEPLMIELKNRGCEIHARSAFLQGLFFADVSELPDFFDEVKEHIIKLKKNHREQLSHVLLKYTLSKPFIDTVIVGTESRIQLENNILGTDKAEEIQGPNRRISDTILNPSNWPK